MSRYLEPPRDSGSIACSPIPMWRPGESEIPARSSTGSDLPAGIGLWVPPAPIESDHGLGPRRRRRGRRRAPAELLDYGYGVEVTTTYGTASRRRRGLSAPFSPRPPRRPRRLDPGDAGAAARRAGRFYRASLTQLVVAGTKNGVPFVGDAVDRLQEGAAPSWSRRNPCLRRCSGALASRRRPPAPGPCALLTLSTSSLPVFWFTQKSMS